jgi:MinD superfamily P-loop ATPase
MKELIVISGKGGTGKTSLIAAFASLAENKVLCDADVDAADLHLLMDPHISIRADFKSGHTANIDRNKCTECELCLDMCKFNAISVDFKVDPINCEGCGVCVYFCPEKEKLLQHLEPL